MTFVIPVQFYKAITGRATGNPLKRPARPLSISAARVSQRTWPPLKPKSYFSDLPFVIKTF